MMKKPPISAQPPASNRVIEFEPLYDSREIAAQCGVSEKSLHRWARLGLIPAVKMGRLWRFRKSAIDEWISSRMAS
jgi:excisionase family DNA binding protein